MSITAYDWQLLGDVAYVTATSDLGGSPTYFHWYADGVYLGSSTDGTWTLQLESGEQVDLVAQDTTSASYDATANAPAGYPSRRTLHWTRSTDTDVERYVIKVDVDGGGYSDAGEVPQSDSPDGWNFYWLTPVLTDLATYTWQIYPVDAAGNEGSALTIGPELIVRKPDAPEFGSLFTDSTTKVRFYKSNQGTLYTVNPSEVDGATILIDAQVAESIDDGTASPDVDSWDCQISGGAFAMGTATRKPHTGADINGGNAIDFDGSDDYMAADATVKNSISTAAGQDCGCILIVFDPDTTSSGYLFEGHSGGLGYMYVRQYATGFRVDMKSTAGTRRAFDSAGGGVSTAPTLLEFYINGVEGYEVWINGTKKSLTMLVGTNDGAVSLNSGWFNSRMGLGYIGLHYAGLYGSLFVAQRGTPMTDAEKVGLRQYYSNRWGLGLTP